MNCIYFKYKNNSFVGEVGNIHIYGEEMDSVCSLFKDIKPISIKEEDDSIFLQYDNCILIIENARQFKKSPFSSYFEGIIAKEKPVLEKYITVVLDYQKEPNLISQINMARYTSLIEKYGSKYGIDANLILAVMAHNNLEHTYEVDNRGRIGIMGVPYEKVSRDLSYYDYENNLSGKKSFSLVELTDMGTNIEAWCIMFQNYFRDNYYNIMAALELINEDYANTVFNAISEYTKDKYQTKGMIAMEPHENAEVYYYQIGVKDISDLRWLAMLMDDNGNVYSEEVLAYFPDITQFRFKTNTDGKRSDDLVVNVQNVYKKDKEIKNT